jgi:hypothetical protein
MSQSTTLILLPQTVYDGGANYEAYTVTGVAQHAAGYYLGNRDLQTVNINLTNVTGNIVIEASLATTPGETDWFKVYQLEANNTSNVNSNASTYTNIEGNFVHMRAKVEGFYNGIVNFVKLSY